MTWLEAREFAKRNNMDERVRMLVDALERTYGTTPRQSREEAEPQEPRYR